ncbi:hypothetical protein DNTS_018358 [Danionella cerebrum]|uniref:Ig-like domain-containing protein n=1 Tax=Danionella cerebrum TaxID=2873325 RepID=A0A553QLI0_9TELE|nr:hypothetical protein DNTS_018358 [Danionella translucida]
MDIKQDFVVKILMLLLAGLGDCLAIKHITVAEGSTLHLRCTRKNLTGRVYMEWRNNRGHTLFFNNLQGVKDPRSRVFLSNDSKFTVQVSNVTLQDEGYYSCFQYDYKVHKKIIKVKVLGLPKIETSERDNKTVIKCSVAVTENPPELYWEIGNLELEATPNTMLQEGSNHTSIMLVVKSQHRNAKVKCVARYRDLTKPLTAFTIIESHSSVTVPVHSSTEVEQTTELMTTTTTTDPLVSSTVLTELSTVSESTELNTSGYTTSNSSNKNSSDSESGEFEKNATHVPDRHSNPKQSSSLLILLVTTLIISLLIVIIFFLVRLRRAHLAWKKENEESDQSVESSKSKSSEEKQSQAQRRLGLWNTKFAEYKVEEPQHNTASSEAKIEVITEKEESCRTDCTKGGCVKETEL